MRDLAIHLAASDFGAQLAANALEDSRRHAYWKRPSPRCLGASGAVNAAVAHSILLSPWRLIIIFAEFLPIPMPAILYGGAFLAKDLGPLLDVHIPYISDRAHGVAHGALHMSYSICPHVVLRCVADLSRADGGHGDLARRRTGNAPQSGAHRWKPHVEPLLNAERGFCFAYPDMPEILTRQ